MTSTAGRLERRTAHAATIQWSRDLWISAFWGEPARADVEAMIATWEQILVENVPYFSLVDARRIDRLDRAAFALINGFLAQRRGDFGRLWRRQVILRPAGLIGAAVSGLLEVAEVAVQLRLFTEVDRGLEWLVPERAEALVGVRDWLAALTTVDETVLKLRELLRDDLRGAAIVSCARTLGLSKRSLQRKLDDAGVSFREELDRARVERATQLLLESEDKTSAIGYLVGFDSESAFISFFRRQTGATPMAWRRRQRSA